MGFKYKLSEKLKVGDTEVRDGVKSTVVDIDPETGAISWDIENVPAIGSTFKEFQDLRKFITALSRETKDEVIDDIANDIRDIFNKYRTHIRKNYPEAYKKFQTNEASTTSSGGASFTPGTGAQYATPYAFSKSKKKPNKATKFMYKLGYKPAPSIPNRKSKVIDYKQVMEKRNMYKYTLGKK